MASLPIRQAKFSGGEISPLLYGDTSRPGYGISLKRCLNWIPVAQGPLVARPGTKYIADTNGDAKARLIPFIAADGNNYLLEFTDSTIKVWLLGVLQVTINATPWTAAMLPFLKWSQVGNVMTICYGGQAAGVAGIAPRDLNYTSALVWAITTTQVASTQGWTNTPGGVWTAGAIDTQVWNGGTKYSAGRRVWVNGQNYSWTSLLNNNKNNQPPADPGTASLFWTPTIDASHPGLGDSGVFYTYTATIQNNVTGVVYETGIGRGQAVNGVAVDASAILVLGPPTTPAAVNGFDAAPSFDRPVGVILGTFGPPSAAWKILYYSLYKGYSYGIGVISGWIADIQNAAVIAGTVFVDNGIVPDFTRQPPADSFFGQKENPFIQSYTSYPAVIAHYEQRRLFARSTVLPQTVWGSVLGNLYRFDRSVPGNEAAAIMFTLASEQLEEIRSIVPVRVGLLMTLRGEWTMRGSQGAGFSRTNVDLKRQSQWGSSWLDPILIGVGILYNTAKSNMVRDLYPLYGLYTDIWDGDDLSQQARHLMDGHTITSWAYQSTPYSVVWAVREDGVLLSLTYYRHSRGSISEDAQPTVAWAQHYTGSGDIDAPQYDSTTTYASNSLTRYNATTWRSLQDQNKNNAPVTGSAFWAQVPQDGFVEAVCVVPEPPEDAVYVVVRRTINGSLVRYLERLNNVIPPADVRQSLFLDCASQFDGTNTDGTTLQLTPRNGPFTAQSQLTAVVTPGGKFVAGDAGASSIILQPSTEQASGVLGVECRIVGFTDAFTVTVELQADLTPAQIAEFASGLSTNWGLAKSVYGVAQLNNAPVDSLLAGGSRGVAVLADGAVAPGVTLVGTTLTLQQPALVVQVGLSYNCDVQLLDAFHAQAEIRNRFKSVMQAGFHVATTRGIWAGRDFSLANLYEWEQRSVSDSWGAAQPGTGYFETEVSDDWGKDGGLAFRHFEPLPATLLGVLRKIELGGT